MKITTILGSPRKKGNTAKVLGWAEEKLAAGGHDVNRINLADRRVNGCKGCYACKKKPDSPGCPQKDDAIPIFRQLMASDAIIYASPLYCWDFSAQMKALIDRHVCLVDDYASPRHRSLIQGRRTALLVTCEDRVENNADLIQIVFDRFNSYLKTKVAGKYIVPFCTTPAALGKNALETAEKLARDITKTPKGRRHLSTKIT